MLIGNWFRQAGHILREAGSWVDKYIGDAVMAIWFHGYNEATPAEIIQILHAVNRLQAMTAKLNQKYELPFPLRIGTGINTGYAMVGNTGSGDHPDYTAIGDTVNAAFRLESATKQAHFDLAMSEKTFSYLQDLPQWSATVQQHTIELKGYTNPITIYGLPFATLGTLLDHTSLEDTTPASEGP